MKVKLYLLTFILLSSVILLASCNPLLQSKPITFSNGSISVYFTSPPNYQGMTDKLIEFLDTAQSTIDVAIYGLNEYKDEVVNELIKKKENGVNVRVTTDSDSLSNYKDDFDKLKEAGIAIVADNHKHIMHDKFVVVDGSKVWTGSTNFTDNGFEDNYNNSLTIFATAVALLYDKEFTQMFNGEFENSKQPIEGSFDLNGIKLQVYFGPKDKLMDKIIDEAKTANSSLYFDIFTFTYKALADEMCALKNKGVTISGVFDSWQSESKYSKYDYLKSNGVDVVRDGLKDTKYGGGLLHNKVMVIDENTDSDPMVITGSANWTNSVQNYNDENLLIIHSKDISKLYYDNFLKIYEKGKQ